jgi:hypothetical protein
MGEKADMLLRLLARAQIAHRDGTVRPPTMAPPIDALAGKLGATATAKPTPVRTIAATSESDVNATL